MTLDPCKIRTASPLAILTFIANHCDGPDAEEWTKIIEKINNAGPVSMMDQLRARVDELESAICEFSTVHVWGHPDWKNQPDIARLFEIANEVMERKTKCESC